MRTVARRSRGATSASGRRASMSDNGSEPHVAPIMLQPAELAALLVRFKDWLQREGQAVGDTDIETARIFLRSDAIRQSYDEPVDPRFR